MTTIEPKHRSDFADSLHLSMSGTVLADQFEDAMLGFYRRHSDGRPDPLIDFQNASYIDIAALTNFTSAFVARLEQRQILYFGVPADKRVRDFLRVWRFPEAFQATTQVAFNQILVQDDRKYLGESQSTYSGLGTPVDRLEFVVVIAAVGFDVSTRAAFAPSGLLEIHYINIGQGGGTLIIGPDGTRILYDFGNEGRGNAIARYLRNVVRVDPDDGIQYTMVSHRDQDHYGGYAEVVGAGYHVLTANFDSGSAKPATAKMRELWLDAAEETMAGAVRPIPVGLRIALGDGAEMRVVAANGKIHGRSPDSLPSARDENDRSISVYIKYKDFDYLLDGDLGAGPEPAGCSDHQTGQKNFQGPVAEALIALGWMNAKHGVDVLHIAHHGSESSTSSQYFNLTKPEVGLISVGLNQRSFLHPREDVTDRVLLGPVRPPCVTARPLAALFQTESGKAGGSSTGRTSFRGLPIGDIRLMTNCMTEYTISGSGRVGDGVSCKNPAAGVWRFTLDEQEAAPAVSLNARCKVSATSCQCPD